MLSRCVALILIALGWSSLAFCGEIHDAARNGDLVRVKALLKNNPDLVFSKDTNGCTPLLIALSTDHEDVAKWLLSSGADVNARDNRGETPLYFAAAGSRDLVKLLLANKADVNAQDNNGDTPLHEAAYTINKDTAELLIAHKADVNAKDNYGDTPLLMAAINDPTDVAELLLANKADVNARDKGGWTPLRLAASNDNNDMVKLLRRHGGHE